MTSAFFRWFYNTHPLPSSCHQNSEDSRLHTYLSSFVIFKTCIYSVWYKRQLAFWKRKKQGHVETVKNKAKAIWKQSNALKNKVMVQVLAFWKQPKKSSWTSWKLGKCLKKLSINCGFFFLKLIFYIVVRKTPLLGFFLVQKKYLAPFTTKDDKQLAECLKLLDEKF